MSRSSFNSPYYQSGKSSYFSSTTVSSSTNIRTYVRIYVRSKLEAVIVVY